MLYLTSFYQYDTMVSKEKEMRYKTRSDVAIASRYRSILIGLRRNLALRQTSGRDTYVVERDIRTVTALFDESVARLSEHDPETAERILSTLCVDNAA